MHPKFIPSTLYITCICLVAVSVCRAKSMQHHMHLQLASGRRRREQCPVGPRQAQVMDRRRKRAIRCFHGCPISTPAMPRRLSLQIGIS
ncbi:hypothetical protein SAY87_032070 [Trapa incisa]|uniref:Secreted protein n=1 Tax=Trapa incisa TaxID=236973 RepID=A0AAN7KLK8_9MYRT|nr:hypothetical protein SAY87_032070 [Trapa incisa]